MVELTMSQELNNLDAQVATEETAQAVSNTNTVPTGQAVEMAQTNEGEQPKQEQASPKLNFDDEIEKSKAFRVRIDRLNRQHRREMQQILQQNEMRMAQLVSQIVQPQAGMYGNYGVQAVTPQVTNGTQYPQGVNVPPQIDANELLRQQEEQRRQVEEQQDQYNFQQQIDKVTDEYEDFNDVANQIQGHITQSMVKAVTQLASVHSGAVDNLYKAWKENPERIKQISRLTPAKQAIEMARLDAEMIAKKTAVATPAKPVVQQAINSVQSVEEPEEIAPSYTSVKPPVKRPLSPTIPKGGFQKNYWELSLKEMIERDKQRGSL